MEGGALNLGTGFARWKLRLGKRVQQAVFVPLMIRRPARRQRFDTALAFVSDQLVSRGPSDPLRSRGGGVMRRYGEPNVNWLKGAGMVAKKADSVCA